MDANLIVGIFIFILVPFILFGVITILMYTALWVWFIKRLFKKEKNMYGGTK